MPHPPTPHRVRDRTSVIPGHLQMHHHTSRLPASRKRRAHCCEHALKVEHRIVGVRGVRPIRGRVCSARETRLQLAHGVPRLDVPSAFSQGVASEPASVGSAAASCTFKCSGDCAASHESDRRFRRCDRTGPDNRSPRLDRAPLAQGAFRPSTANLSVFTAKQRAGTVKPGRCSE